MQKNKQKIVLIGGPGTGKTSVIKKLISKGYSCMQEISREVTLKAKAEGIDQLFLTEPLLFSKLLLKGREEQYLASEKSNESCIFFDRGIPDVTAYMDFFNTKYPKTFIEKNNYYKYDAVFHFSPWEEIYTTDNERYESFETSKKIDSYLLKVYEELGYSIITVPFCSIEQRTNFILNSLSCE